MKIENDRSARRVSFSLGLGTGISGTVFAFALLQALAGKPTIETLSDFLYRWETLIAGVLALWGAYLTVAGLERQLAQNRAHEEEIRLRKLYAARAGMPAALAQIVGYARDCLKLLEGIQPSGSNGRIIQPETWQSPEVPAIPKEALSTLQTCIESAGLREMPKLAWVLEEFQILHSRLSSLFEDISYQSSTIVTSYSLAERITDYLEFEVRCSKIYDYARRRADEIDDSISGYEVRRRASFAGFEVEDYPGMSELVERRYKAET